MSSGSATVTARETALVAESERNYLIQSPLPDPLKRKKVKNGSGKIMK